MRDTWKAAKVGLMIVAGIAAVWGVYQYVEEQAGDQDGYEVYAMFDDVQGLVEKSRVVIAGIPVGHIQDIRLVGGRARVDIHIREGTEIHTDGKVAMRQVSLLGEKILAINPGSPEKPMIEDGGRLTVVSEGVGTDEIMKSVSEIADDVRSVTEQLERSFGTDEAGNQMADALKNLSEAIKTVNETIQANQEVINRTLENVEELSDEGSKRMVRILEDVEATTEDIREIIGTNKEGLQKATGEVEPTVSTIHDTASELEDAATNIKNVTERIERGEGTIGRLTQDETLINEVEGVVEGVGNIVGGISRLQTIVELRSEYNFIANTFKSYVSLRLQPREDRYFLVQLVDDPRGKTSVTQTTVRRSPPAEDEPPFYQETRETREDALRFSFMFAKRISFATFRFGILESTGGIGVDFHLFDDKLEINTDMFAIGEQVFPRIRVRAAYEVIERLWVLSGVDDVLNNETRDFFLGAMLRFNDEDLKSILPFAGGAIPSGG